ncbi:transcription initiation factor TFIID subunit 1 [Citrus sinensis]|nr:transcription initiation factor TFIID subunit 1 [Citrus sinensis]
MAGYDSGSASKDGRDEDDAEEYEDVSEGNRLLGFMFGNVDNAGDLDVDYLDEDAKEHLAAVADKLGPSLTDIDLSVNSPQPPVDAIERDYDEKAEDAVDYEDIDEQYKGPEIQIASEEDYLLPKKEYFAAEVSLAALKPTAFPFDDENYDEDEELEKEHEEVDKETEDTTTTLSGEQAECAIAVPDGEKSPEGNLQVGSLGAEEDTTAGVQDYDEELADILKGPLDGQVSTPLPVLCVEEGKVILRFSEIFGIHEPLKKGKKRDQRNFTPKDKYNTMDVSSLVEEDEEVYLKGSGLGFPLFKQANIFQHDISSLNDDDLELVKFGVEQDAATISEQRDEQWKDSCICSEPMKEESNVNLSVGWKSMSSPNVFPLDQHDWEENILWDNSPAASDNSRESHKIAGADVESALMRGIELDTAQNNLHERSMSPNEKDCIVNMQNSPVLSETFGSKSSSDNTSHLFTESRYHPQLLRLESQLDLDNHNHANGIKENVSMKLCQSDAVKRLSKHSLQNRDMMEGSWLDNIIWEPVDAVGKPKLILDLQDEQILFEILDNKHFYMNGKISQHLQSNSNKRTAHGIRAHHFAPALKLQTMELKLSKYCEERPLLLSNVGMGANLCTYYQKSSPGDQAGALLCGGNNCLGNVLTLEPGDKSPFLGDIKAGCSQSSLETNMYGAPVFPHKVATTDFLLVRSAKGKISIRRIDKVAVVGQQDRENIERLEITGVGDPSGRGLGFSYVRAAPKASVSSAMVKKKVAANRGGSTVTGTDADLRRLSMEAAREVLLKFNVPEEMIAKQTRWHRIAMIRKLSSEQAASAVQVDPTTISKQVQSLSAADDDEIGSDSEHSDLDSFAGDLENLLDAEEFEEEESNYDTKHDKVEGVKGLKMRRCPIQVQAEEEIEDDAAEVAELCRLLMDDDEAKLKKKKKKTKAPVEGGLSLAQSISGLEIVERLKKANKPAKHIAITVQPNGSHAANEQIKDPKEEESLIAKRNLSGTVQAMKKNGISPVGKKVKIVVDIAICIIFSYFICQSQLKSLKKKKLISKSATKIALIEAPEGEKSSLKTKVVPVKFKCSSADKLPDKFPVASTQSSDQLSTSDVVETANKSVGKVNRIVISNKPRPEETQVESHKPSIVIRPPVDTVDKSQAESHKPSIIIRPPANTDREQVESHKPSILIRPVTTTDRELVESHKPSIVIRPPADKEREPPQKKIIIKRPKDIIDLDRIPLLTNDSAKRKVRDERNWWEEEEKRRNAERIKEERARRIYEEERRFVEERERFAELRRYEESIRKAREEELLQKAKKKKKPEIGDDYLEDYRAKRNDRRMLERDRGAKRKPGAELGKHSADYGPPTKRRRGGKVGLSNILERIVETLRENTELSYLYLKPVAKKEAPDYLDIIERPMDLSTIRGKVRRMEYKDREDFRHDVWQIAFNAHKYNDGRHPAIPPLADQLLELCDYLIDEYHESLSAAEAGIQSRNT